MSSREVIVLGTASQVPTRYRAHNGIWVSWDGVGILVDPGEGTQRQMVLAGARTSALRAVLVTHFHGDHCLGLAGVTQRISLDRVPHEVAVVFPASGRAFYDRLRHASIFDDHARMVPVPVRADGPVPLPAPLGVSIDARHLAHGVDTIGYRLVEPAGWTVDPARAAALGVRGPDIGTLVREGRLVRPEGVVERDAVASPRPGQVVAVVMDTRVCAGAVALADGADLLICESTYLESERTEAHEHGHLTARQAGRIAREAGARSLVLTHFSQRYPMDAPFEQEAALEFAGPIVAAKDLVRVAVPSRA